MTIVRYKLTEVLKSTEGECIDRVVEPSPRGSVYKIGEVAQCFHDMTSHKL